MDNPNTPATDGSTALRAVKKLTLTRIGTRSVSTFGWRLPLFEEHLTDHLAMAQSKKWCDVACAARTMFGHNTVSNRAAVRKRMNKAFRDLLAKKLFLAVEYDAAHHNQISAFKLFENGSGAESENARYQLAKMRAKKQLSDKMLLSALAVVGLTNEVI
jgi:hypothetical protein